MEIESTQKVKTLEAWSERDFREFLKAAVAFVVLGSCAVLTEISSDDLSILTEILTALAVVSAILVPIKAHTYMKSSWKAYQAQVSEYDRTAKEYKN